MSLNLDDAKWAGGMSVRYLLSVTVTLFRCGSESSCMRTRIDSRIDFSKSGGNKNMYLSGLTCLRGDAFAHFGSWFDQRCLPKIQKHVWIKGKIISNSNSN